MRGLGAGIGLFGILIFFFFVLQFMLSSASEVSDKGREMKEGKGYKRSSGAHYYHHLVDVTQLLLNFGIRDEATIVVGELHDSIEDTWMTYEYIEREFGTQIAKDVQILNKDPNIDYKKDLEALQKYLIRCFS